MVPLVVVVDISIELLVLTVRRRSWPVLEDILNFGLSYAKESGKCWTDQPAYQLKTIVNCLSQCVLTLCVTSNHSTLPERSKAKRINCVNLPVFKRNVWCFNYSLHRVVSWLTWPKLFFSDNYDSLKSTKESFEKRLIRWTLVLVATLKFLDYRERKAGEIESPNEFTCVQSDDYGLIEFGKMWNGAFPP